MDIKEKIREIWWNIKWKYSIKDWVWRKYNKALFNDKTVRAKLWNWLYDRLRGQFSVYTKHGEFGVDWYGFLNLDIYLGAFCRITFFWCRDAKTFIASFFRRYYRDTPFAKGKGRSYFAYIFGHELKSDYIENKFVYYSAWRWGRYLPWARDVNVKKTGKLFGIIGWGETEKKKPLFEFRNPPFSWIISEWVERNAWAICSCDKEETCKGGECEFIVNQSKVMLCFPRRFLKPGDVLIFFDYEERSRFEQRGEIEIHNQKIPFIIDHGEGSEESGRYLVITEESLEQWEGEELGFPDAIVVRAPNLAIPQKENAIIKFSKKALNKIKNNAFFF
jgi:hypothetical protein